MDGLEILEILVLIVVSIELTAEILHLRRTRSYGRKIDAHIAKIDEHLSRMDQHIGQLDERIEKLDALMKRAKDRSA